MLLGISYKSFIYHINTPSRVYSPTFGLDILIRTVGGVINPPIYLSYVNADPINSIDLSLLGPGITALLPNKLTVFATYLSVNQAAMAIDGKIESQYISVMSMSDG